MICLTAATAQARVKDSGHQLTMVQGGEATNDEQQELPTDATGVYLIQNEDHWNLFCNNVNNGINTYNGKTVRLQDRTS
jgi:hypothetical protein